MLRRPTLHDPADLPPAPTRPATPPVEDEEDPIVGCQTREDGFEALRMSDLAREVTYWDGAIFYKEDDDGSTYEVEAPDWLAAQRAEVREWVDRTGRRPDIR